MTLNGRWNGPGAACRALTLTAAALLGASHASAQTTVNLTVVKDATLRGGIYADTTHRSKSILATRASTDPNYVRRAALTFDTEASVPANVTIQSATLVLTVEGGDPETRQLAAYLVPVSFDEPYATWNTRTAGVRWTNAGGDTTGSYTTATVTSTSGSQVTFNVTSQVQTVVNGQLGSRFTRFLVTDTGGSSGNSYKEFHSRESGYVARRPRLIVTYGSAATTTTPSTTAPTAMPDSAGDIAMGPEHVAVRAGRWIVESKSGAINGKVVRHPDAGLAKINDALGTPANYFEMKFQAQAGRAYRLWIHGRADGDHWANDSVHAQFSGSVTSTGSAAYRIGTNSATWLNLEECGGCGLTGWQWQDNGYGSGVLGSKIYFNATGTHTIRIQTREDGLSIDRVLLSPVTYMSAPPGGAPATQQLLSIASTWPEPRFVIGDLNAWPDQPSIGLMNVAYYDSWAEAEKLGTAKAPADISPYGATRNGRIDHIHHSKGSTTWLYLKSVEVPDTRDANGYMPSDHRPVLAIYEVR